MDVSVWADATASLPPIGGAPLLAAPLSMGAGAAMLITVALAAVGLILLERWSRKRAEQREAAKKRLAPSSDADRGPSEDTESEARKGTVVGVFFGGLAGGLGWLWTAAFGGPKDEPDPTLDMDPDELAELRENEDIGGDGRPFL
ncbi:MAG: hypothetical protein AAGM38_07170 [Pseudomonadota bacterium]